ncbi:MAG: type 1 glutamine amidotransferase [Halobacteria archaeon]|nr:type 1 glutamine amidotransferase [Halobacteria archaeon]
MKTALLNVSHNQEPTRINFLRILIPMKDVETDVYNVHNLEFPDYDEIEAALITGSADSVYEEKEHIRALKRWIRDSRDHEVSLFGVCYGHQAIADAFGGDVEPLNEREIGYREVKHSGDPLFEGVPERFTVFQSHGDEVVKPPDEAQVIARNEVGIQGLRIGKNVTVQFHPEFEMDYARDLTKNKEDISDEKRKKVLSGITRENYLKSLIVRRIFDNFFG